MTESKYRTLLEALKKDVLDGKYNSGSSFPSIRALVRKFGVSKNTVQHAIDELVHQGLITRIQGRGTFVTRQGSSRKLGLIVPDIAQAEFFSLIVREISRLAQKEGYTLLFCEISSPDVDCRAMAAEKSAREFVEQGVAGVICQPIEFLKDSEQITRRILSVFDEASVPVVLCDYDFTEFPKRSAYDVVGIDNVKAGASLYEHVKSAGAKRIGFLVRPYASQSHLDRLNGAIIANKNARGGVNGDILLPIFARPEDSGQIRRYVRRNKPDAIICGNDKTAAILKGTLDALRIDVSGKILLAGFDDATIATIMSPRLTTIHQPCDKIAEVAFYRLLERISNPSMSPESILLSGTLVERESTSRRKRKDPLG